MAGDRTQGTFGSRLREARERRGVSLRQIANATKISISALEALERNDISRLPGGIFSRAFVRSYAIEVGLDPEETIHDFIAQFPHDSVTAGHPTSGHVEDHEAIESDRRMASTFVRLIVVSIPIAAAVLYFGIAGRRTKPPPVEQPAAPVAAVPSEPRAAEPTSPSVVTPAVPAQDDAPADRLTLALSATRPCWISASADGKKVIERLMQPGDQGTVEARNEITLTAGDAAAVTVMLNGAETKPLGKAGQAVTVRLNLTNFKDYLAVR